MNVTLELPPEVSARLCAAAQRDGLSLEEYAQRILAAFPGDPRPPRTGAELVAHWQAAGVIGSRLDIADSLAFARAVRRQAETRSGKE